MQTRAESAIFIDSESASAIVILIITAINRDGLVAGIGTKSRSNRDKPGRSATGR